MLLGSQACRLGLTPKWKWHSEESPTLAGRAPPPPSLHTISAIILNIQYTCILFYPSHHFIRCGQTLKLSARSSALPPKVTTTTHPLRPDLLHLLISGYKTPGHKTPNHSTYRRIVVRCPFLLFRNRLLTTVPPLPSSISDIWPRTYFVVKRWNRQLTTLPSPHSSSSDPCPQYVFFHCIGVGASKLAAH